MKDKNTSMRPFGDGFREKHTLKYRKSIEKIKDDMEMIFPENINNDLDKDNIVYYISSTKGNDNNDGLDIHRAFKTLGKLHHVVNSIGMAGNVTVYFDGTEDNSYEFDRNNGKFNCKAEQLQFTGIGKIIQNVTAINPIVNNVSTKYSTINIELEHDVAINELATNNYFLCKKTNYPLDFNTNISNTFFSYYAVKIVSHPQGVAGGIITLTISTPTQLINNDDCLIIKLPVLTNSEDYSSISSRNNELYLKNFRIVKNAAFSFYLAFVNSSMYIHSSELTNMLISNYEDGARIKFYNVNCILDTDYTMCNFKSKAIVFNQVNFIKTITGTEPVMIFEECNLYINDTGARLFDGDGTIFEFYKCKGIWDKAKFDKSDINIYQRGGEILYKNILSDDVNDEPDNMALVVDMGGKALLNNCSHWTASNADADYYDNGIYRKRGGVVDIDDLASGVEYLPIIFTPQEIKLNAAHPATLGEINNVPFLAFDFQTNNDVAYIPLPIPNIFSGDNIKVVTKWSIAAQAAGDTTVITKIASLSMEDGEAIVDPATNNVVIDTTDIANLTPINTLYTTLHEIDGNIPIPNELLNVEYFRDIADTYGAFINVHSITFYIPVKNLTGFVKDGS